MSTVDEIRARMAKACSIDYRDTDDDFMESAEGDLEYLLAEHQRMAAVVEAAREIVADADRPQLARNWATERMREAIEEYESGQ